MIFDESNPESTRRQMVGASVVEVGRFTYGLEGLKVKEWGEGASLKIGAFCSLAEGVKVFLGGNHRLDWISTYPFGHIYQDLLVPGLDPGHPSSNGDVVVGNCVWLGSNVTIMSGVKIGDGAVIAANSTVTKDVGNYEIFGGNPAKLIRPRFDKATIDQLVKLSWWELDLENIKGIAQVLCSTPDSEKLQALLDEFRPGI